MCRSVWTDSLPFSPGRSNVNRLILDSVTIYGNDVSYCSSATLSLASFSDCLTNVTVNQFSVDCQDYSVAISSTPQVVPIGADPPQTSTTSTSSGLSDGAKAGIAVASSVVGVLLIGLFVFFVIMRANRRRREHLQMTSLNEADTISAAAPPYSELPHDEKKAPVELPSRASHPVEAPGDQNWPLAHELPVEELSSEVDGSATTLRDDLPVEVKEKDVKTNPESERQA